MPRPHPPHENSDADFEASFDASLDPVLEQALDGEPRAHELQHMVNTLLDRFHGLKADYQAETDPPAKEKLRRELVKLREQIGVLAEEARITEFIEDAVRVGLEMRKLENN